MVSPTLIAARQNCDRFVLLLCLCFATIVSGNDFDPYVLNGGLSAAVAGPDYVVMATDTRMMGPGGYDILERNHVASRLWAATPMDSSKEEQHLASSSPIFADGSLSTSLGKLTAASTNSLQHCSTTEMSVPPVLIASSGCSADCEMLKRQIRADLRTARSSGEATGGPAQVAHLLGQVLYSRRSFPFYSFCLVAGWSDTGGQVYVYDAIGSHEQVAVATSGTGRELLQPILDHQFQSRTGDAASECAGSLQLPPLPVGVLPKSLSQVDCSADVAVSILTDAYRAVAEREIGVGDQVAFCVLQRLPNGRCECQVWTTPLKKH